MVEKKPLDIDKRSVKLDRIVPEEGLLEVLATGFKFTEGPVWSVKGGYLLFSDIPANQIKMYTPGVGVTTFREPSRNSNGLTFDKELRLLACEFRRVSRTERDGSIVTVATHYGGKRLNNPNDIVVKTDGAIYFTDPTYGCPPEEKELPYQGVYRVTPKHGELTLLVDDFEQPNGLTFSPDEKLLYIADSSDRCYVRVFDVQPDGSLANGRLFADLKSNKPGGPDGMKVDVEGNVYVSAAGGLWIYAPTGKLLGIINTPERPFNCGWGDDDWRSMYLCAHTSLYRILLKIPGIPVP